MSDTPAVPGAAPAAPDPYAPKPPPITSVSGATEVERTVDMMMAAPSAPTRYKVSLAAEAGFAPAEIREVTIAFHEAGLSQGTLDALMMAARNRDRNFNHNLQPEHATRAADERLVKKWGAASVDERLAPIVELVRVLTTRSPVLKRLLSDPRVGNNPALIDKLDAIVQYRASKRTY